MRLIGINKSREEDTRHIKERSSSADETLVRRERERKCKLRKPSDRADEQIVHFREFKSGRLRESETSVRVSCVVAGEKTAVRLNDERSRECEGHEHRSEEGERERERDQ